MEPENSFEFAFPENPLAARMLTCRRENRLTDVTIKIGEDEFHAHRVVIEDATPVLKAMFSENWKESNGLLTFQELNIDPFIVETLLDFFYTGKLLVTTDNAHSICMAAHFLDIPELLSGSENFISNNLQNLDPSNVIELFLFSDKLQLNTLRKSCGQFLVENHEEALKVPQITGLNAEDFKIIMNEMSKETEQNDRKYKESLFGALIAWFEYDQAGRSSSFPSLLKNLPLYDLSMDFLATVVATQKAISDSTVHSKLVLNAINRVFTYGKGTDKLFCFGRLSFVSILNIATGEWTYTTPTLSAKSFSGGAVVGKKIYLIRGDGCRNCPNSLEVYDCTSNSWSTLQPMSVSHNRVAVAAMNEFIYVTGGIIDMKFYLNNTVSTAYRYCVKTNQWQTIKAMQTERYGHQLVELHGLLYAVGGIEEDSVERYDPKTDEWTMVASMKHRSCFAHSVSHNDKIYVHSEEGFEVYTPESNTWKTLKSGPFKGGSTLVTVNDKLWALGDERTTSVYEFDTDTEQWTQLLDMNQARASQCSFVVAC